VGENEAMPFGRAIPALPIRDVGSALMHYTERLGFEVAYSNEGFARVVRDECEIHLWQASDRSWLQRDDFREVPVRTGAEDFIAGTASCRIEVDDAAAAHAEMAATGALHGTMGDGPQETPWGTLDVHVLDADGNLLTFFQRP